MHEWNKLIALPITKPGMESIPVKRQLEMAAMITNIAVALFLYIEMLRDHCAESDNLPDEFDMLQILPGWIPFLQTVEFSKREAAVEFARRNQSY